MIIDMIWLGLSYDRSISFFDTDSTLVKEEDYHGKRMK